MNFDTATFKVLYESKNGLTKIVKDKNIFYKYNVEYDQMKFTKMAVTPEYLIIDKGEKKKNFFIVILLSENITIFY